MSILFIIINTMLSFFIVYIFNSLELVEVFKFMNICYKDLFFENNCPSFTIMLRDFSLRLYLAMIKKTEISIVETCINQLYKIVNHLNILETNYDFQLCL